MKFAIFCFSVLWISTFSFAQNQPLTQQPNGGNKKAYVSERIGITDVGISYHRPGVKGREGKIWGTEIVHYGFKDLGFGTSKASPWRAGANENTVITFSTDVKVEGQNLPAGKYGFFIAMEAEEATVIFSRNSSSWGSYYYDPSEDALRVTVKPEKLEYSTERLKYEFLDQTENGATIALFWEKLKIPFKVEVDYVSTQIASYKEELRGPLSSWEAYLQAANFVFQRTTDLELALKWSEAAISENFIGQKNFSTLSLKAQILEKMGEEAQATTILNEAMPMATMTELHQYGRSIIKTNSKRALEVFEANAKKYPNQYTTYMGLVRGYSANGDYTKALENARLALPLAPDSNNKTAVENMIQKLSAGNDVN